MRVFKRRNPKLWAYFSYIITFNLEFNYFCVNFNKRCRYSFKISDIKYLIKIPFKDRHHFSEIWKIVLSIHFETLMFPFDCWKLYTYVNEKCSDIISKIYCVSNLKIVFFFFFLIVKFLVKIPSIFFILTWEKYNNFIFNIHKCFKRRNRTFWTNFSSIITFKEEFNYLGVKSNKRCRHLFSISDIRHMN